MDYDSARAPPPSYALEDGSDNESDFGDEAKQVTYDINKTLAPDAIVIIKASDNSAEEAEKGTECVFLVGEAGESFAKGVKQAQEGELVPMFDVLVDREQASTASDPGRTSCLELTVCGGGRRLAQSTAQPPPAPH